MSAIPANDPRHPALGLPPALPVRDASGIGGPPSGTLRSFSAVFQSVDGAAEGRHIEEELAETELVALAEGVAAPQIQEAPVSGLILPTTAIGSRSVAGVAPVLGEAVQARTQSLAQISEDAPPQLGDAALAVSVEGQSPPQDTSRMGTGVPPEAQRAESGNPPDQHAVMPRLVDFTAPPAYDPSQPPAQDVSPGPLAGLGHGQRDEASAEARLGPRRQPAAQAHQPVTYAAGEAGLGPDVAPRIRPQAVLAGPNQAGFAGYPDLAFQDALQPDAKTVVLRQAGSGPGLSVPAQMSTGYLPAPSLAVPWATAPDLGPRDARAPENLSAEPIEIGLADDAGTQGLAERSDWRVALLSGPNGPGQALATLARTDLPQALAQQITAAIQARDAGKSTIDLRLAPEELGRVRLRLTSHEGVMTVTVVAERPETLDLMRRHVDALARGMLDVGYQEARFSFAGQDQRESAARTKTQGAAPREEQGLALIPASAGSPTLLSPALAGGRINVLI